LATKNANFYQAFGKKNQKLIMAALYAISSDPEQEEDTRKNIKKALDSLSTDRDRSRYNIKYNGQLFINNIQKSDIGLQTVKLLEANRLIDNQIIEYLKQDRSSSLSLIKKREEFTETEKKYRKYKINGQPELIFNNENYFVVRNWGVSNIENFMNKFSDKFPGLEYEKN
jgi:hypothetical protein